MKQNYQAFVERMIARYEGGYGWDRDDSGGPTKYGITCWDLAEHRHQKMDSMKRWAPIVAAMMLNEAEDIYAVKYASASRFDDLRSGADVVVFDTDVNSGPGRGNRIAQQVVGVAQDGVIGPVTLAAVNACDALKFVNEYCDARMIFLRRLTIWSSFGRGWTARVKDLRGYASALATGEPQFNRGFQKKETLIPGAHVKAYTPKDLKTLKARALT